MQNLVVKQQQPVKVSLMGLSVEASGKEGRVLLGTTLFFLMVMFFLSIKKQ